jgi:hypothetical protein
VTEHDTTPDWATSAFVAIDLGRGAGHDGSQVVFEVRQ